MYKFISLLKLFLINCAIFIGCNSFGILMSDVDDFGGLFMELYAGDMRYCMRDLYLSLNQQESIFPSIALILIPGILAFTLFSAKRIDFDPDFMYISTVALFRLFLYLM